MAHNEPARGSSGIYHEDFTGSSQEHLAQHGAPVAGGQQAPAAGAGAAGTAAPKTPFYKTRKFIICQIITAVLGIVILFVLLFPVVKAIAQLVLNRSVLNINLAAITSPTNTSFQLHTEGIVTHAGFIPAKITFINPINVSWVNGTGDDARVVPLGSFPLDTLAGTHKRATLNQTQPFTITDPDAFAEFTGFMITSPNFTWRLQSENLKVQAVKFPVSHGLHFEKEVTLNGFNNFDGHVKLEQFALPQDDPQGGITFNAITGLNNPSPFSVDLGTVVFNLSYNDVFLGQGSGPNTKVAPGANNVTLDGRLVPHNGSTSDLQQLSTLFSSFLNGQSSPVIAQGVSTTQADGSDIAWLSAGLKRLRLTVPFQSPEPINPIQSIAIGYLNLSFTPDSAWSPITSSNAVHATMKLPFGFSANISQIENTFGIVQNNTAVANLSTPLGATQSDIKVMGPTDTEGNLNITLASSPLQIVNSNGAHNVFSSFNKDLTDAKAVDFRLVGHAKAIADLPIGQLTLDPIDFDVPSALNGLQGLEGSTQITSVDVLGGTTDHINLAIDVDIANPSQLNLDTGDLTLQLFRGGGLLGTTLLPNLTLNMGKNSLKAQGMFQPNMNNQGHQTLNDFVQGKNVDLQIAGYSGSSQVQSLLAAFESLSIGATLPALQSPLLQSTALTILPTTGKQDNVAQVKVNLNNPFTGGLTVTKINSTVSSHGLSLGTIDTSTNFPVAGKKVSTSPDINFAMNLDPPTIFTLLRRLAVQTGQSTEQIDGIVQLGGYNYVASTDADAQPAPSSSSSSHSKRANIYTGFNLPNFVDAAFKDLRADINLASEVSIGDYQTSLDYTQPDVTVQTDETLNLLLPILAQPIVQKIIDGSKLGIDTVIISNPQQESFDNALTGSITNAGPFDAEIEFGEGLTISWSGKPLGNIAMPKISLTGDVGAQINVSASFKVADVPHLTDFTKVLLTEENFTWDISGNNLTVNALGISVSGVNLNTKSVTLKGMNGLKNGVKIKTFDLPANDPAGGIHLTLDTSITNPSQVGVALNNIGFRNFVNSTFLGPAGSTGSFTLAPQSTFDLPLAGRLVPQSNSGDLAAVSKVFTDFIHDISTGVTVYGDSAGPSDVSWLNDAIKSLSIQTILPSRGVIQVIKSIGIEQMELDFTTDTAYDPSSSSNNTVAAFQLPFAFPIDIVALQQTIIASTGGQAFAQLAIPKSPSHTDVEARIIHLTFGNVPFAVYGDKHSVFQQFLEDTTVQSSESFGLSGSATSDASTAIGVLTISDIAFDVQTSIAGLQGLNAKPANVSDLDVNHGFPDYLLIKVNTLLNNPSNLTIGTGDVAFALQFQDQRVGSALLSNLKVSPGDVNYPTDVHFQPASGAEQAGRNLLQNYLQGVTSDTVIFGVSDTTPIESLQPALEQIHLTAQIPALHQNLVTETHIEIPVDIAKTGIAQTTVTLSNPFTASINLLQVTASAIFENLTLGTLDHVDLSSNPIHADGHSNVTSQALPLKFNLNPAVIIQLLAIRAQQKGVDLGPLTALFQIVLQNPNFQTNIVATVDSDKPTCVSGHQFDVDGAILNALQGLQVELDIDSVVKLDDYQTELAFKQFNVPAITDQTALYLIGVVSPPIVQSLVNGAQLGFDVANITNISDEGFDLSLSGHLTGTGPLDAEITFVEPVVVNWNGQNIATIALPPVCAAANDGVPHYVTSAKLSITDLGAFTQFATFLLHNPSFEWTISTDKLRVTALGINFDNVQLSKTISFKAFNNLPGVTISNFDLPHDDPAGGITISTDSMIPSPAQLGIQLGTVGFNAFFDNVLVGPLTGTNLFLAPEAVTTEHLTGRMIPQSGDNLNTIGTLFSNFLAGKNQTLQVVGDSVDPSGNGQAVSWLSAAFKTLTLDVTLPGKVFKIIQSIDILDLELELDKAEEDFNPLTSSQNTDATFKNPFGFSLQVVASSQDLVINFNGQDTAELKVPTTPTESGVSTGNVADLTIHFSKQTLHSLNNDAFGSFFAQVTDHDSAATTLKGTADVVGRTAIGDIPISGIPFDVPSTIKGINSFGGQAGLSNVTIIGSGGAGGDQFIRSPLTTALDNPSNISLLTNNVALPVMYKGVTLGRAAIDTFNLVPGHNVVPTEFHYEPDNANDTTAQSFLQDFLTTGNTLPLTIKGDGQSSPYGSLVPALEGVTLQGSLQGLNQKLLTHINVFITLDTLVTNLVSINFDVQNPLDTDLVIEFVQSDGAVNGQTYAHFDQSFDNFVVPAHGTANSGTFGNVLLTQGALASLDIIPLGELDISAAQTVRVGAGGYTIPWLHLFQPGVPTTYSLDILGLVDLPLPALKAAASSIVHSSSAAKSASASSSQASNSASTTGSSTGSSTAAQSSSTSAGSSPTPQVTQSPQPKSSASQSTSSSPTSSA